MLVGALRLDDGAARPTVAAPAAARRSSGISDGYICLISHCYLLLGTLPQACCLSAWYTTARAGSEMGSCWRTQPPRVAVAESAGCAAARSVRVTQRARPRRRCARIIIPTARRPCAALLGHQSASLNTSLAALADRGQDGNDHQHQRHSSRPALRGRSTKVMKLPREITSAWRSFSSISLPSTKPSSSGAGSKPNLTSA